MAATSSIEWTDATWNPITGCTLVSEGCRNCYAARVAATRLKNHPSRKGLARINAGGVAKFTGDVRFNQKWLDQPLRWKTPRRIFVCAHGDLFHESVPDDWIDRVFAVMALAPHHTFQVLTKRPERMRAYLGGHWQQRLIRGMEMLRAGPAALSTKNGALRNVWLGVSVEEQITANARVSILLDTPAALRFVSAEPLLGPLDLYGGDPDPRLCGVTAGPGLSLGPWWPPGAPLGAPSRPGIDWVIAGGESGPGARPSHPDWFRSLRDQCAAANVPFHFKQWGRYVEAETGVTGGEDVYHDTNPDHIAAYRGGVGFGRLTFIARSGHFVEDAAGMTPGTPFRLIESLGKTAAGRLLDGVQHDGMPS